MQLVTLCRQADTAAHLPPAPVPQGLRRLGSGPGLVMASPGRDRSLSPSLLPAVSPFLLYKRTESHVCASELKARIRTQRATLKKRRGATGRRPLSAPSIPNDDIKHPSQQPRLPGLGGEARVTGRRGVGQTQRGPAGQGLGLQRDAGQGRNPRSGPPPKTGRSWHLRLRGAGVRLRGACVCVCVCPAKAVGNTRQMRSSLSSGTWPTAQPPAIRQHLSGAWSGTRGRRDSTHPFSPFCR